MKEQFQHKLTTSFFLWFDNFLLTKGEAFSNKTGEFFYYDDSRLDSTYKAYGSPFKQWVTDSSVTGATIPSGVYIGGNFSGRNDGVVLDFENGRGLISGSDTDLTVTGEFSVKDFNVYITNDTEEDLVVENKYTVNSRLPSAAYDYIQPYDDVVPAIFISSSDAKNTPFALGGIGDLKNDSYNYDTVTDGYSGDIKFYINEARTSKLTDTDRKSLAHDLYVGFIDFDVQQYRFRFN